MSNVELKETLINSIRSLDNSGILLKVYNLLELENTDIEVYKLLNEQKDAIREGRNDIKAGKSMTNEKFKEEMQKWLKE